MWTRAFRPTLQPRQRQGRMPTPPFRATSMPRKPAHRLLSWQMRQTLTLSRQRFHPLHQHKISWLTRRMWIRVFRPTSQPRQQQDRMPTPPFRATSMPRKAAPKLLSRQMLMTLTLSRQRFHPLHQHRISWLTRRMWIMWTRHSRVTSMPRLHAHRLLSRQMQQILTLSRPRFHPLHQHRISWQTRRMLIRASRRIRPHSVERTIL